MNSSGLGGLLVTIAVVLVVVIAAVALGIAFARRSRRASAPVESPSLESAEAPPEAPAAPDAIVSDTIVETPVSPAPTELVERPESTSGRFARLRGRLGATLAGVLHRGSMSADDYDALEEALLLADVGASATDEILAGVKARLGADFEMEPRDALRAALLEAIDPAADRSLALGEPGEGESRSVIVVGVNGVGKTTTVGKLARVLVADGYSVVLGAADTFRAAAADQLETWGARVGVPVERSERDGADPASVAFAAAERAVGDSVDALLIDTAGRLQNKQGLMDELGKIVRVVGKVVPRAEVLLVLDATTGQNGLSQARVFAEATDVTGIVLTKLDGSAKGGIVVAVQKELGVPVKFVGLGEGADDLAPFDPAGFVDSLVGDA
ncbi:MAG: signal recognition particle-docking protein FtsY [Demequina sp.]|nr:signal recognition particle-docking protein FtsY [Demequina sp.]